MPDHDVIIVSIVSSFTSSIAASRYKIFLRVKRILKAVEEHNSIITPMGKTALLLNKLTNAELIVPVAI